MKQIAKLSFTLSLLSTAAMVAGCGHDDDDEPEALNVAPSYLGAITSTTYDGNSDDLLTAGLGKTGIGSSTAPGYADALNPTPRELRRHAIYSNYRALVDTNPTAGYGSLYGPNLNTLGVPTPSEGKIAGTEYLAYADDGSGRENVTLMVQVPAGFDPQNPCIVTGTSSGSRGVYGAIGTSGDWGLKNNCAVAYSDKGSGTGLYSVDDDSVNLQNGVRATRTAAGKNAQFAPVLTDAERAAYNANFPGRIAFKHAHSQLNPEKDWGRHTLQAVEFAFYVLNEKYGALASDGQRHRVRFTGKNTWTIAASISNGAAGALLAAEQDTKGLISGIAINEPQIQPNQSTGYLVRQGGTTVPAQGKLLLDYSTYGALYQPCVAGGASGLARCASLVAKGLLTGASAADQQANALARLRAHGWLPDSDPLQATHASINVLVAVTYANQYGRFSATDHVCGFSFAPTNAANAPIPFTAEQRAIGFATQNGILGNVIYEQSVGGARQYAFGISPSTNQADQSLDGFLCLRSLATGVDAVTGAPLAGTLAAQSARVRAGMADVTATGNLRGKPAIMVHGRSDTLMAVNHTARAYLGLNAAAEGAASKLRYIEVTHGNHFDTLTSVFPQHVIPLNVYLNRALDAMYAHLKTGAPLPPSQVVKTTTRASATEQLTVGHLPFISLAPGANAITVSGATVDVPN